MAVKTRSGLINKGLKTFGKSTEAEAETRKSASERGANMREQAAINKTAWEYRVYEWRASHQA